MRGTFVVLLATLLGGCVERTLTVRSDPPESLLFLNGTEVGRTPFEGDFTYYGWYDVELRKEGYETLKIKGDVIAPWWQWVPFDLAAELVPFPLRDRQSLSYTLRPTTPQQVDPQNMLRHAESMQGQLESSPRTKVPSTQP
jgi:hypothetical protein